MTLTIADQVGTYGNNYQVLTAASFISIALPLVAFCPLQRYFIRSILAGSVSGTIPVFGQRLYDAIRLIVSYGLDVLRRSSSYSR